MIQDHLIILPNSIKEISDRDDYDLCPSGRDGYGIVAYTLFSIHYPWHYNSYESAHLDPWFDPVVANMSGMGWTVAACHIRWGTTGPPNIPNPHPFIRDGGGSRWCFGHNGGIDLTQLTNLINARYPGYLSSLTPPPIGYPSNMIDSELLFLLILKCIDECGGSVWGGVLLAVSLIDTDGMWYSALNFLLIELESETLWAFRRCRPPANPLKYTLYYYYSPSPCYCAIASEYPTATQGNWQLLSDYYMIELRKCQPPIVRDIRPQPVGGFTVPIDVVAVDKPATLLTPYVGLASTILVATVATSIYAKHVKRRKEK